MRYVVKFASKEEGMNTSEWEPAEGDGYTCSKREAFRRRDHLIGCCQRMEPVDGVVPWLIEVWEHGGKKPVWMWAPAEIVRDDKGNPIEHDTPGGEWAKQAA